MLPINTLRDTQKYFGLKTLDTNTPREDEIKSAYNELKDAIILNIADKIASKHPQKYVEELCMAALECSSDWEGYKTKELFAAEFIASALELSGNIKFNEVLSHREANAVFSLINELHLGKEDAILQNLYYSVLDLAILNDDPRNLFFALANEEKRFVTIV